MEDTKECKSCGEEIKSKASKCPHCQTPQSKWAYDRTNIKHVFISMFIIFGLTAYIFNNAFSGLLFPKDFNEYNELIKIQNTTISFKEKACGKTITVIGEIINNSTSKWTDIYFEARFYDKENKLIDTISDKTYDLMLTNNSTSTFKIT